MSGSARMVKKSSSAQQCPQASILVADDEEEVRDLVREILEEHQYRVFEARDGKEALSQVSSRQIDLVIVDLVMPEQEGIETIQLLRRECPQVKVLAISGAFGGSFLKCAMVLGAHAILKKPFSCETLVESVHGLLAPASAPAKVPESAASSPR